MKKFLFSLLVLLSNSFCYGQSAQAMLDEIEGKWLPDENGEVTVSKIIMVDSLTKDRLFEKASVYFNAHFIKGQSFIDTKDKQAGLIVAKGVFVANQKESKRTVFTPFYTLYIVRVDLKDKRAKLSVTLTGYDPREVLNFTGYFIPAMPIGGQYPLNIHGWAKEFMGKVFCRSFKMANDEVNELEKFLISTPTTDTTNW